MLSITLYDVNGVILRIVEDLIAILTEDRNCSLMKNSSEMRIDLFENALCKREEDKIGWDRRLLKFYSINLLDMKSKIES